jgi:hypothetical protein
MLDHSRVGDSMDIEAVSVPDEAVRIAADGIESGVDDHGDPAEDAVTALARAGWLCDPRRRAALEALYTAVRSPDRAIYVDEVDTLDALSPDPARVRCGCPRTELGMMAGNSEDCPIHPLPGCPNPACGETWIEAFHGDHCESCGWRG